MTLLAPDNPRLHREAMMLRLDPPAIALLRALVTGGAARHPVFGGPVGQAARRLLTDQGAIDPDGELTPPTLTLLGPCGARPGACRRAWAARVRTSSARSGLVNVARPSARHSPTAPSCFASKNPSRFGAGLVSWLGVRPLPERGAGEPGRPVHSTSRCRTRTAWVVERHAGNPTRCAGSPPIDAGHDGWRTATGPRSPTSGVHVRTGRGRSGLRGPEPHGLLAPYGGEVAAELGEVEPTLSTDRALRLECIDADVRQLEPTVPFRPRPMWPASRRAWRPSVDTSTVATPSRHIV